MAEVYRVLQVGGLSGCYTRIIHTFAMFVIICVDEKTSFGMA
jgi:hypothetical protein